MKVKVNDKVVVIAGKYRGKTGNVLHVYKKSDRLTVEKINIRTKHIRKSQNRAGERIHYEAPFNISNVKVICPSCSKPTRIGYQIGEDKKKHRICKKCLKIFPDQLGANTKKKKTAK